MKNLLIIYPHWPPSNLAGVHRPRLIANFTGKLGWHPIVLTVSAAYYEEAPDPDLHKTVAADVEVIYTKAYGTTRPRLVGDIGLRAFPFLHKAALELLRTRKIDFIWIPVPSFYMALLGRLLHEKTAVPYGIDYIDPWVRDISTRKDLRSRASLLLAKRLEPLAVKKAALITGVSTAYYAPVLERNFPAGNIPHVGMPYGFDPRDHEISIAGLKLPWEEIENCKPLLYAGAFLPKAHLFVETLFKVIGQRVQRGEWDAHTHLFFLGTGGYAGTGIADYAKKYGIEKYVHEKRERFPYLQVLNFLSAAYAVMSIGSTEQHYTASKIFQALLSKRPVLGVMHEKSSAVQILKECKADNLLICFNESMSTDDLISVMQNKIKRILNEDFSWNPLLGSLEKYSARESASALVEKLNQIIK